jgi:fatty acid desaturase
LTTVIDPPAGRYPIQSPDEQTNPTLEARTRIYADLRREVKSQGILDRSPVFYAAMIPFSFLGYAATLYAFFVLDGALLLLLTACAFAFFTAQLAGIMHDCGHRAVFAGTRMNDIAGTIASGVIGMAFSSWRWRHNQHHAHVNVRDKDPDAFIPFLATSREIRDSKVGVERRLIRWQALYYYPLGGLVSFSNRLGTLSYFVKHRSRRLLVEFVIYLPAMFVLFVAPFAFFPIEKALFVFLAAHLVTGVYLANCFAPNHKAMPIFEDASNMSFIEMQVRGSRSVRGGLATTTMLVGLNLQIEHHLFPSCPRNKLQRLTSLVKHACVEADIEFVEQGYVETSRAILANLSSVAREP